MKKMENKLTMLMILDGFGNNSNEKGNKFQESWFPEAIKSYQPTRHLLSCIIQTVHFVSSVDAYSHS